MKTVFKIIEVDGTTMDPPFKAKMSVRGKYHPARIAKPSSTSCVGCGSEIMIGEQYFYFEELQGRCFCLGCVKYEIE